MPAACIQDQLNDIQNWKPDHCAVIKTITPPDAALDRWKVVQLDHPGYPYEKNLTANTSAEFLETLKQFSAEYIRAVQAVVNLPGGWFGTIKVPAIASAGFGWLPITWGPIKDVADDKQDPRGSFWVTRYVPGNTSRGLADIKDLTLVRLAGDVIDKTSDGMTTKLSAGTERGIRLAIHIRDFKHSDRATSGNASIIGLSAIVPGQAAPGAGGVNSHAVGAPLTVQRLEQMKINVANASGIDEVDRFAYRGIDARSPHAITITGRGIDETGRGIDTRLQLSVDASGALVTQGQALYCIRRSQAFDSTEVFVQDPASMGPADSIVKRRKRRLNDKLNQFRKKTNIGALRGNGNDTTALSDDPSNPNIKVIASCILQPEIGDNPANVGPISIQTNTSLSPRSRSLDAAHAYYHAHDLFARMAAYGLIPQEYFKFAQLPLVMCIRSGIAPGWGKDGQTVNAQVEFLAPDATDKRYGSAVEPDFFKTYNEKYRPLLEVQLALGDLKRRDRPTTDFDGREIRRADYLGIASDPRWVWHEFAHVLIGAATSELELRFAHSIGDALAAICNDPRSELFGGDNESAWRGVTYPWITSNRRHDRRVDWGWSWSGTFHKEHHSEPGEMRCNRKAYASEQILSTTLFRLYRCMGGDTLGNNALPDRDARQSASDYLVFLLMKAVSLLGPAQIVGSESVEQFVSALVEADHGTGLLETKADWPYLVCERPRDLKWEGGGLRKVIRWVFEAQGLYAADPKASVDAPGEPPCVDIYIDNRRPDSMGDHPRGGYMPVSLHWGDVNADAPLWHASREAISYDPSTKVIDVTVRNRGATAAENVEVTVWIRGHGNGAPWKSLALNQPPSPVASSTPGKDGTAIFGPYTVSEGSGRYFVLAIASCPADMATHLEPNNDPQLLTRMIACDNNMGLRVIDVA